ncbi:antitoxin MazE5 [Nostocoides sp. HKS02]|uniref:antitoxin MazE5 n=1 Tax=Nostocoides sp. HKS02 TaxID=1813880 RepID=UPI0012B4E47A|nr:antitoxin MazE5 [Tetrasphaera sp. HKS02]QGN58731.1 antitoxin MazE5 [Tetrasphaera sp. HKS02]
MAKARLSTTVDSELLNRARTVHGKHTDASLLEAALTAYLAQHRDAEIDAAYAKAYAEHPIDEPDAWGDLASWSDALRVADPR